MRRYPQSKGMLKMVVLSLEGWLDLELELDARRWSVSTSTIRYGSAELLFRLLDVSWPKGLSQAMWEARGQPSFSQSVQSIGYGFIRVRVEIRGQKPTTASSRTRSCHCDATTCAPIRTAGSNPCTSAPIELSVPSDLK